MRLGIFALAFAVVAWLGAPSAQARPNYTLDGYSDQGSSVTGQSTRRKASSRRTSSGRSAIGGRPSRWCGWWMRTQKGGGPEYNLAANWRRWGRHSSGPQVGAVVVWPHHVGMITGRTASGQWVVKSGNDGGRVRERARSVSGAVFRVG